MDEQTIESTRVQKPGSPMVVAIAGWILPGMGYVVLGQTWRGVVAGTTILLLILMGIFIGGIRVIELPGFDNAGKRVVVPGTDQWVLTARPVPTLMEEIWFMPQLLNGPVTLLAGRQSLALTRSGSAMKMHGRLDDIGILYVAIAGVLNLIIIIDSAHRASKASLSETEQN